MPVSDERRAREYPFAWMRECWPASPTTRSTESTNSWPGTGPTASASHKPPDPAIGRLPQPSCRANAYPVGAEGRLARLPETSHRRRPEIAPVGVAALADQVHALRRCPADDRAVTTHAHPATRLQPPRRRSRAVGRDRPLLVASLSGNQYLCLKTAEVRVNRACRDLSARE
jgi:hypothetical protein